MKNATCYTATAHWSSEALDAHPNKMFNGYEPLGTFDSEDAARAAITQAFDRPEITIGMVFYQRNLSRNQREIIWRKTVDRPSHRDTPLEALIRSATVKADGTDRFDNE